MTPTEIARDQRIREYASESDLVLLAAIDGSGDLTSAAAVLGLSRSSVQSRLRWMAQRAVKQGYSPAHDMTRTVPEPFVVRGVSTYYNKDGKPSGQWVKSRLDDEKAEALVRAAAAAMSETMPRLAPLPAPEGTDDALCNLYVLTDAHVGMLASRHEGGANWDLKIAERTIFDCFDRMIVTAPPARTAFIAQLGDFLHFDGLTPVTPTSGHVLDADSRFEKVVATAVRLLRRIVDGALVRHELVYVLMAEGNHDPASSIWLRAMFRAIYENEPRVHVIESMLPYYVHQHGTTMLAFHHGHLKRPAGLPLLMAAQFPETWGATTKRYVHVGHLHHIEEKEHPGIRFVQHPTLAAKDAWASRGGWLSERQASVISYHDRWGEVARTVVTPEMVA